MTTSINNNNSNNNNDVLAFLAARRQQITTATGLAEETASAFEKQLDEWLLRVERNAINSEDGDVMNGESAVVRRTVDAIDPLLAVLDSFDQQGVDLEPQLQVVRQGMAAASTKLNDVEGQLQIVQQGGSEVEAALAKLAVVTESLATVLRPIALALTLAAPTLGPGALAAAAAFDLAVLSLEGVRVVAAKSPQLVRKAAALGSAGVRLAGAGIERVGETIALEGRSRQPRLEGAVVREERVQIEEEAAVEAQA